MKRKLTINPGLILNLSSMKSRILINIVLFTSIPILITAVYLFVMTKNSITDEYRQTVEKSFLKCVELIDQEMMNYVDKSNFIFTNKYLITSLQKDYKENVEEMMNFYNNIKMFGEGFETLDYEGQNPFTIYTYNKTLYEGKYIEQIERIEGKDYFSKVAGASVTDIIWSHTLVRRNEDLFISFYRNLNMFSQKIGILEFNVPFTKVKYYMDFIGKPEKGSIYYKDAAGTVMYSNDKESHGADAGGQGNYLTLTEKLINGDILMTHAPLSGIERKIQLAFIEVFGLFLVIIVIIIYASNATSRKISGRLNKFINKLKLENDLLLNEELAEIDGNDEVSVIQQRFKNVIGNMNQAYQEAMMVKKQNAALEIELLQSRINPHLLYNSLSALKWPALRNKDVKTVEMIDAMTKYYRMALNKENDIVQISSELDMVREYVKINEFSSSQKYILEIQMEERVLSCYTFKHLLQPIVENAILHGLNGKEDDACIRITGFEKNAQIIIEVADNGHGMDNAKIDSITNLSYNPQYGGYGLRNVIKRIHGYYGKEYGIQITSAIGKGTRVIVNIAAFDKNELLTKSR